MMSPIRPMASPSTMPMTVMANMKPSGRRSRVAARYPPTAEPMGAVADGRARALGGGGHRPGHTLDRAIDGEREGVERDGDDVAVVQAEGIDLVDAEERDDDPPGRVERRPDPEDPALRRPDGEAP